MERAHDSSLAKFRSKIILPLYEAIRPTNLGEYIGQSHLIASNGAITNFIKLGYLPSMILSGPPGVGKTTIASLISRKCGYVFVELSATDGSVSDLKALQSSIDIENHKRSGKEAFANKTNNDASGEHPLKVVVFIDEIHRFSKTQQDFLLPYIEKGSFTFIGATTVEPHKRIRSAILSRCQVFQLRALTQVEISEVLVRAILFENVRRRIQYGLKFIYYNDACIELITKKSHGDTRIGINLIELLSRRYIGDENIYTQANKEPCLANVRDLIESVKSMKHNQSGIQDPSNVKIFRKLFDCISRVPTSGYNLMVPVNVATTSTISKSDHKSGESREAQGSGDSHCSYNIDRALTYFKDIKYKPVASDEHNCEYLRQMQVSDDSEIEETEFYSDNESEPINLSTAGPVTHDKILSAFYFNLLLTRGEEPSYIGNQLLLYVVSNVQTTTRTFNSALSFVKSLKHANVDQRKVVYNFIEWIHEQPKVEISKRDKIDSQIKLTKSFLDSATIHPSTLFSGWDQLEIDFDPRASDHLFSSERLNSHGTDKNPVFMARPITDFEEDEVNIGDKTLLG